MLTVYRICKTKYAATAFDGEGAFRFGGRWNTRGTHLVYAADSLALAALEMLVHLGDEEILLSYSFVAAQIPASLIVAIEELTALPPGWNRSPAPRAVQNIGNEWARSLSSAALTVPSAIIGKERNYLLNPRHPDWEQIVIGQPQTFTFDERLKRG